ADRAGDADREVAVVVVVERDEVAVVEVGRVGDGVGRGPVRVELGVLPAGGVGGGPADPPHVGRGAGDVHLEAVGGQGGRVDGVGRPPDRGQRPGGQAGQAAGGGEDRVGRVRRGGELGDAQGAVAGEGGGAGDRGDPVGGGAAELDLERAAAAHRKVAADQ